MSEAFQLLVAQAHFAAGEIEQNQEKMEHLVNSGMDHNPDVRLLLFPELAPSGYDPVISILNFAEEQDGLIFHRMSRLAAKHKVHLAYGYVENGGGGSFYNSLSLIGPAGEAMANYRKIQLTKEEKLVFQAGDSTVVVETELGKIGLLICWDIAFPELARLLTLDGAELILAPSAWDKPFARAFNSFAMSRALDNSVYFATCNHVGKTGSVDFFGESSIYGPDGIVLACAGEDSERVARCDIDFKWSRSLRDGYYSMLKDRRCDVYNLIKLNSNPRIAQ